MTEVPMSMKYQLYKLAFATWAGYDFKYENRVNYVSSKMPEIKTYGYF